MDVLSSRLLLRPRDLAASQRFYREILGLAVYREFAGGEVYFLGNGLLEVSGRSADGPATGLELWLQVRDVGAEHTRLAALGVPVLRAPQTEPWGLVEMWIADPDGIRIVLVQVPREHPLRSDPR
ncbi:VOC family protein [Jatrophihabitans sp.]|uniref:VOC family protein n=1 Tax=Jatrophihabitans sp. TaxID=1932789 RepID=UPI002CC494EF|nr:VOC family protein [Jatrophihabitans sp.]